MTGMLSKDEADEIRWRRAGEVVKIVRRRQKSIEALASMLGRREKALPAGGEPDTPGHGPY